MRLWIAITSVFALALAGCARSPADGPGTGAFDYEAQSGVLSLIGLWTVVDADEEADAVLRIAPQKQLSLWRTCGALIGSWAAADTLFLAQMEGGSTNCFPADGPPNGEPTPSWLLRAENYRTVGAEKMLLDPAGNQLARLLPGGRPKLTPDFAASEAEPPVVTDEDRAALTRKIEVKPPLTQLKPERVLGRWAPAVDGTKAFVEFKSDGTWTGSDGCNGNRGRWVASANAMLATSGASTLIACDGAPVPNWLANTAVAARDVEFLVLFDANGAELGRLKKA